jgi:hypothetical protein
MLNERIGASSWLTSPIFGSDVEGLTLESRRDRCTNDFYDLVHKVLQYGMTTTIITSTIEFFMMIDDRYERFVVGLHSRRTSLLKHRRNHIMWRDWMNHFCSTMLFFVLAPLPN